jgi:hypothetical protein
MDELATARRRRIRALVLGLLATGLLYLPPFAAAPRLDRAWVTLWSDIAPRPRPVGVVLLELDDPSWVPSLARITRREQAQLVITAATGAQDGRAEWMEGSSSVLGQVSRPAAVLPDAPRPPLLTRDDVLADPGRLADKIVIAGPFESNPSASAGPAAQARLLAQLMGNDDAQRPSVLGHAAGWLVAALWLGLSLLRTPRSAARRFFAAAGGPLVLAGGSGSAWLAGAGFVPIAGPVAWLASTTALYSFGARSKAPRPETPLPAAAALRLAAAGQLDEAWRWYRSQTVSAAVLAALYDIARAFESHGREEQAADIYYAIAQADAGFRDVTRRLIVASQSDDATTIVKHPPARPFGTLPAPLGRYELLEQIGHGSAGYVYLAKDPTISRIVALKVIDLAASSEAEEQAEARSRFLREAETAGRLNHPGIITVFDVGESDGRAYIAMEYSKGRRLSDFTEPQRLLRPALVLDLIARTADALHYAHQQNVVHRDIKPANIMYDSVWDSVKIADFGIARLIDVSRTRTGVVLGTPSYMAPEQLEGENVNGHTDLFALGVSLYQLLTGRLPFQGNSMTKLMFVIANEPHLPVTAIDPDLPGELNPLLDTALAKEPGRRFSSGAEMAEALRRLAARIG